MLYSVAMRIGLLARCLLVAGTLTRGALADGPELSWRAPPECGEQAQFEAGVSRIVGKPWQQLSSLWSQASLSIERVAAGFELRVSVLSTSGMRLERSVTARTCGEAVEAAELIVAASLAAVDPAPSAQSLPNERPREPDPLAPEPPPALEPARPRSIPTRAERAPPPVKPRARRWRIYSAARLGLVADLLPKAAPSAWLAFGVAAPAVRLEAFARATGSGAQAVSRSGSIEARLLSGGATACYRASLGAVELAPCAGLELGQFRASGRAIENAHGESALWSAALLQGRLSWRPATRLALTGGAELGAPFRHIEIALSPSERPFSAPPLELGCFWGLDLGFW